MKAASPGLALGVGLTVLAGAMLATMDATGKYLQQREVHVLQVVWGRYLFHTLIVFAVLSARGGLAFLRARRPVVQTMRAGALLGATLCLYTALGYVPLADATAVQFFAPVLVTLLSGLFLREHVGPHRLGAVIAGFLGVVLIVRPGLPGTDWHMLLPLGAACMLSLYLLLTRQLAGSDGPGTTIFYTTALGAVVLSLLVPGVWRAPAPAELLLMVSMGALGAGGHLCLINAFGFAPASVLSPFLYAQIAWAAVLSVTWFGDPLTAPMLFGTLVLVGSGLYLWWRESLGPAPGRS